MELESGTYVPRTEKTVTVWPRADANGDGPEVYQDRTDDAGNLLGRDLVKDNNGNPVREYSPPPGFTLLATREPGADRAPGTYVRTDGRGVPIRDAKGNAVSIEPGSALVEHPDGTTELLRDDWSHVQFRNAHEAVKGSTEPDAPASDAPVPDGLFPSLRA
jgi:hypothetical protein